MRENGEKIKPLVQKAMGMVKRVSGDEGLIVMRTFVF